MTFADVFIIIVFVLGIGIIIVDYWLKESVERLNDNIQALERTLNRIDQLQQSINDTEKVKNDV